MVVPSELDLAKLIVGTLNLDLVAEEIDPDGPLFGEGLSLDSIDGLEIGMELKKKYGVSIDSSEIKTAFQSLNALREFIGKKILQDA
jgi:acyl carrier protein